MKTCKDCGSEFVVTEEEIKAFEEKGHAEPKRCEPCRAKRRKTIEIICKDCQSPFFLSEADKEYFESRCNVPKRCDWCRNSRRVSENERKSKHK